MSSQNKVIADKAELDRGVCVPNPPPPVGVMKKATDKQAVVIVSKAWVSQTGVVKKCADQIDSYKTWGNRVIEEMKKK